jgi:hypothetical protein
MSRSSRMVHSRTPRRCERKTSSLPQRGHLRVPNQSEMACVRPMAPKIYREPIILWKNRL